MCQVEAVQAPRILCHKVYGRGYKGAQGRKRPLSDTSGRKERRHRKATYAVPLCRPMDTSRYICSSTRCPVSGTNLYVHLEGPWRYGDFICPKPRSDLLNSCLLSNVMLHTETEQNDACVKIRTIEWRYGRILLGLTLRNRIDKHSLLFFISYNL